MLIPSFPRPHLQRFRFARFGSILRKQSCRTGAWFFDSLLSFSGSLQCAKDGGGRRGARGQEGQGYRGWCPGGAFTRGPERESHVSEETRLSLVPVSVASEG